MTSSRITLRCLMGAIALTAAATASAEDCADRRPRITVTGEAEVRAVPDQAVLYLAVVTLDKDLLVAKANNDTAVKSTLDLARRSGVAPEWIQTGALSINKREEERKGAPPLFLGYEVAKSVTLVLDDLKRADDLLTLVVKAGVNRIDNFDLRISEMRKHKDRARALAIRAAREKAAALAAEIGQTIGKAFEIKEEVERSWSPGLNSIEPNAGPTGDNGSLAAGQNAVRARVVVSFELQ